MSCDSLHITARLIPEWIYRQFGNPVPQGRRLISVGEEPAQGRTQNVSAADKIRISGNKSFSLNVGRTGQSNFSQGMNIDFDARLAGNVNVRGSISDRIAQSADILSGSGGTAILSELDKYFFEIEAGKVLGRGGDIDASNNNYLPSKRIKGMLARYDDRNFAASADLGRPAGRFVTQKIIGRDGLQGPYQAIGSAGTPAGIVPGSDKVYLDGRHLEGGSDRFYQIDYPSGRITFSPEILITDRSRIEIDYEEATTSYEQVVYDFTTTLNLFNDRLIIDAGGRRESDAKDRLRFGALSPGEISILENAGDMAQSATRDGAVADTGGSYALLTDTLGNQYYQFVGPGNGQFDVSFSFVGQGAGEYRYLGDGVYEYAGAGSGSYAPIIYLPLPQSNDFYYTGITAHPYGNGTLTVNYQGNRRDRNLFSSRDDGDNFRSMIKSEFMHHDTVITGDIALRYREAAFDPVNRIYQPDDVRLWALPNEINEADELRLTATGSFNNAFRQLELGGGYLKYRGQLRSYRLNGDGRFFKNLPIMPFAKYELASSRNDDNADKSGLYENYTGGLTVKPQRLIRVDVDYSRDLSQDKFDSLPYVERFDEYRAITFLPQSTLTLSHRVDFTSGIYGRKGPQQNKLILQSERSFGRLTLSVAATLLNQKKLDSDRGDRKERLFRTGFRFTPRSGWLSLQADYRQNSSEARYYGYRYIQVDGGDGDYRYEDGQYLYDPDGDFIRVREERGEALSVSTGEKSHNILIYPGRLPLSKKVQTILSQISLRAMSEIYEDLKASDGRNLSWVIPWTSPSNRNYLNRTRRERYAALLFPQLNFYILNLTYKSSFEERDNGAQLLRHEKEYEVEIKNKLSEVTRSTVTLAHNRRFERGLGLARLELRRNDITLEFAANYRILRVTPGISVQTIKEIDYGGEARGISFFNELALRHPQNGEVRVNTEIFYLDEQRPFAQPEYLVTDGQRFGKSALIALVANYNLSSLLRINVNLRDRFFENRSAEFSGRGELVARF